MEDQLKEVFSFLARSDRPDLQLITLENILALTGTSEYLNIITQQPEALASLVSLLHNSNTIIAQRAVLILVNISACNDGPAVLLARNTFIQDILEHILNAESHIADACCMILSNVTRPMQFSETIVDSIEQSAITFDQIINVFTKSKFNNKGQHLYYLGPVLSNLSQSPTVRKYILDKEKCVIQRLLPFTEFKDSIIKRGGVVGTLRNCCFDTDFHSWLLSEDVDILPRLLLPLAGNTEYDDEDNERLPSELQYLPDDKLREDDPDIRCMLLEAVTQLCATRTNREYVRDKNTYVILRELHKWEKDRKALLACENLVDILIRTEEEIGEDNLKDVDVPQHLHGEFEQIDREFLTDT